MAPESEVAFDGRARTSVKVANLELKAKLGRAFRSGVRAIREFAYATPSPRKTLPGGPHALERPRTGLALSGGFARGLAHIGVLKALTENQIPIDALAGTSVGSIVAGAFASGRTVRELIDQARNARWGSFARWTVARLGLATNERMEGMLRRSLRCLTFEELAIPLAVVVTDLSTGEAVTFRHGDLIPPLRASCSFPGLFTPVEYQGRLLVDGAISSSVPVAPLLDCGVDVIIAVNLKTNLHQQTPTNLFQVVGQAFQIAQKQSQSIWREQCDVIIEPEVADCKWDEFDRADELISAGERAALETLPALRALLEPCPIRDASTGLRAVNAR